MEILPDFKPGQPFGQRDSSGVLILDEASTDALNRLADAVRARRDMTAAAPLMTSSSPGARSLTIARPTRFFAILSGSGNPYSFTQAYFVPGTGFVPLPGGMSGNNAYESTGATGLNGKATVIFYEPTSNDFRFQLTRFGCNPTTTQICARVTGCQGLPLDGATVTVTKGATTIGSGTTVNEIISLALVSGGSGYTNGTNYSLGISSTSGGSGATGLFDVVGGAVTNIRLTSGGSGWISGPSISIAFSAAGSGSGAGATATVAGVFCQPVSANGVYTVSVTAPRYTTPPSQNVTITCGNTGFANFTGSNQLAVASGYWCCSSVHPISNSLFLTCSQGTFPFTHGSTVPIPVSVSQATFCSPTSTGNCPGPCYGPTGAGTVTVNLILVGCTQLRQQFSAIDCSTQPATDFCGNTRQTNLMLPVDDSCAFGSGADCGANRVSAGPNLNPPWVFDFSTPGCVTPLSMAPVITGTMTVTE